MSAPSSPRSDSDAHQRSPTASPAASTASIASSMSALSISSTASLASSSSLLSQAQSQSSVEDPRNLYVDNLPSLSDVELRNLFLPYGPILKSRIAVDPLTRVCAGYGFVMFERVEDAQKAIDGLHGHTLGTKKLRVTVKKPKAQSQSHSLSLSRSNSPMLNSSSASTASSSPSISATSLTNLYVSGLPLQYEKAVVEELFKPYGQILDSRILKDRSTGKNRGIAMIRYEAVSQCEAAIAALHDQHTPPDMTQPITVKFANEKSNNSIAPNAKHVRSVSSRDSRMNSPLLRQTSKERASLPPPQRQLRQRSPSPNHSGISVPSIPRIAPSSFPNPSITIASSPSPTHHQPNGIHSYHSPTKSKPSSNHNGAPKYSAIGQAALRSAPLPPSPYHAMLAPPSPYLALSPHHANSVYALSSPTGAYHHHHSGHHHQQSLMGALAPYASSPGHATHAQPPHSHYMNGHAIDPSSLASPTAHSHLHSQPQSQTSSLYVYGLPSSVTDGDLDRLFGIYGQHSHCDRDTTRSLSQRQRRSLCCYRAFVSLPGGVHSVHIMKHPNGSPKGFAFVNMNSPSEAANAVQYLDAFQLGGRQLRVQLKTHSTKNKSPSPTSSHSETDADSPAV